jgi:type IV pilus assembly protein PilN
MNINLLPWREIQRERKKKELIAYGLMGFLIASLSIGFIHYFVNKKMNTTIKNQQIIHQKIAKAEQDEQSVERMKNLSELLVARMTILSKIQHMRRLTSRLFDELVRILPSRISLIRIERKGKIVTLFGLAESHSDVSQLMRNIEKNAWISKPKLTEIHGHRFKLNFVLRYDSKENHYDL